MSEEKIGMYSTEEIYEELATGFLHHSMVDAMYFKIKDLQQKVEQLEKENKELKYDSSCNFHDAEELNQKLMEIIDEKNELDTKLIQLENIRKEAIEELSYMSTDAYVEDYDIREKHYNLLMNILNKGSEKE